MRRFRQPRLETAMMPPDEITASEAGTTHDYTANLPPELFAEEKRQAADELRWKQGMSDYYALRTNEEEKPLDIHRLAMAEQGTLGLAAQLQRTEPLARNLDLLQKYLRGETTPDQKKTVEQRLEQVVNSTAVKYGDVNSWLANVLVEAKPTDESPLDDREKHFIGGFGLAALEENDFDRAFRAFETAGLIDDEKIQMAIQRKMALLERSGNADDLAVLQDLRKRVARLEKSNTDTTVKE